MGDDPGMVSLGPLDDLLGYHLRRAWNEVRRDFEFELGPLGVTRGMIGVLSVVSTNPGIAQGAAAARLDVRRANMVKLVAEMVAAGWIDRGEDPNDRRAISLSLTPAGEQLFARALERVRAHERRVFAGLGSDDKAALARMLASVAGACGPDS